MPHTHNGRGEGHGEGKKEEEKTLGSDEIKREMLQSAAKSKKYGLLRHNIDSKDFEENTKNLVVLSDSKEILGVVSDNTPLTYETRSHILLPRKYYLKSLICLKSH